MYARITKRNVGALCYNIKYECISTNVERGYKMTGINEWLGSNTAKIVICNNKANAGAWVKCKNRYDGMVLGGIKVETLPEIAAEIVTVGLVRENSQDIPEIKKCDESTSVLIIRNIIKKYISDPTYMGNIKLSSVDVDLGREVLRVLNELRLGKNIKDDKLNEKEEKLYSFIDHIKAEYEFVLCDNGLYDDTRLIVEAVKFLEKYKSDEKMLIQYKQYEIGILTPWDIRPVEQSLIDLISSHSKNDSCKEIDMREKQISEQNIAVFKAYTFSGEIRNVVRNIKDNNLNVSDVEILCMNRGLANISMTVLSESGIASDMSGNADFGCNGILRFIVGYCNWLINGRVEDLGYRLRSEGIIYSGDIFGKNSTAVNDRIKRDEFEKRIIEAVKELNELPETEEISVLKLLEFLHMFFEKYSKKIKSVWNEYKPVYDRLSDRYKIADETIALKDAAFELKNAIEKIKISIVSQTAAVRISVFSDRFLTTRDNLFIVGMADMHFRMNNADSPVLPSMIMQKVNAEPDIFFKTAEEKKEAYLTDSLKMFRSSRIVISYASYDIASEIPKDLSVSLYLNELMRDLGKIENNTIKPDGEENGFELPKYNCINKDGFINTDVKEKVAASATQKTAITSSALCDLLSCPRKYYYNKVCGIYVSEERTVDTGKWLNPAQKGLLCHEVMEKYCGKELLNNKAVSSTVNEKSYNNIFKECSDTWKVIAPPVSKEICDKETKEYKDTILNTIKALHEELANNTTGKKWVVFGMEEEVGTNSADAYCSVKLKEEAANELFFYGTIDRIDRYTDANNLDHYRIIDYKTGKKNKKVNEIKKGLWPQHIVYAKLLDAYLKKKNGEDYKYELDEFVYLFPFENREQMYILKDGGDAENKVFEFDDKTSEKIIDVLFGKSFASIESREKLIMGKLRGDWRSQPECCMYCNYKSICKDRMGAEL